MHVQESAKRAKDAALRLATLSTATKNRALEAIADALIEHREHILEANRHDVTVSEIIIAGVIVQDFRINLDRCWILRQRVINPRRHCPASNDR